MARPRHPDKHIEAAVRRAELMGWTWAVSRGHPWGELKCPGGIRGACIFRVSSTPANPFNVANRLDRKVAACPHYGVKP